MSTTIIDTKRIAAAGVRREEGWWFDEYEGTSAQLIAAGLITEDQLPGRPGGPKVRTTFYNGVQLGRGAKPPRDERHLSVQKRTKTIFRAVFGLSQEECERRRALIDSREELKKARIMQTQEMKALPKTHDEYRRQSAGVLRMMLRAFRVSIGPREWSGYNVDSDTLGNFDTLADDLVELIEDAGTVYSVERQQARIQAIQAMTIKADAPLQAFIGKLSSFDGHDDIESHDGICSVESRST